MTINPDSPRFIIHTVPEYAYEKSKLLYRYFVRLKELIATHKWNEVSENDISFNYNIQDGYTEIKISITDTYRHSHHFILQLLPDNGFGDGTDYFGLLYFFEGNFIESNTPIRSFADYLTLYLFYEGYESKIIKEGKGLSVDCPIEYAFEGMCKLIDVVLSKIRPTEWFYTQEINTPSFVKAYSYLSEVFELIKIESRKGRWPGLKPEHFLFNKIDDEEVFIEIIYAIEGVWEIYMGVDILPDNDDEEFFCSMRCYPDRQLPDTLRTQLHELFAQFLSSLKIAKGYTWIGGERGNRTMCKRYFHIEDTFDHFCSLLDEAVPAVQSYPFLLPCKTPKLTSFMNAMKEKLEALFSTDLTINSKQHRINEKLKTGSFLTLGKELGL